MQEKTRKNNNTKFMSMTYVWSWLRGIKELQISYSCNNSESSPLAPYCVIDSLQLSKYALAKNYCKACFWHKGKNNKKQENMLIMQ